MDESQIQEFEIRAKMLARSLCDLCLQDRVAILCDALGYLAYYHGVPINVASDTARCAEEFVMGRIQDNSNGFRPMPLATEEMN